MTAAVSTTDKNSLCIARNPSPLNARTLRTTKKSGANATICFKMLEGSKSKRDYIHVSAMRKLTLVVSRRVGWTSRRGEGDCESSRGDRIVYRRVLGAEYGRG